jgi:hypothetical protein
MLNVLLILDVNCFSCCHTPVIALAKRINKLCVLLNDFVTYSIKANTWNLIFTACFIRKNASHIFATYWLRMLTIDTEECHINATTHLRQVQHNTEAPRHRH